MARTVTHGRGPHPQDSRSRQATWLSRSFFFRHKQLWVGAALVTAAAAILIAALWPNHDGPVPPAAVSTVGQNQRACLLTDHGQPQSAAVFADLQHAAASHGHINVQQTTLPPQATDAAPELASLIQQRCAIIFALGPLSSIAAQAAATNTHPVGTKLIVITDNALSGRDLTTLPATGLSADQISQHLVQAIN